ncbi:D-glucuronyl C5-epimerase family protein [Nafulsella turpanensis]|uniref:D-glucuronyl C5-epimerase family protein n=1 Tax=Nafulsella turpanensis TaxID=1265690 RepID=UPI0003472394|nr:D-glucuronyl C5-epimerase family protein [Nafulsella turpanensis]
MYKIKLHITLITISLIIAILISDLAEPYVAKPAISLMSLVQHGKWSQQEVDQKYVPAVLYNRLDKEYFYNPVYIGVYGLYYYNRWLENGRDSYFLDYYTIYPPKDINHQQAFINIADWYCRNVEVQDFDSIPYGIWTYPFKWPIYNLKPGWVSGMAQGLAIQVLIRAYEATHEKKYLDVASLALNSFLVPIEEGGVTIKDSPTEWWYEEYASKGAIESRVLNGMAHTLIGIREYHSSQNDSLSEALFQKGLNSLVKQVKKYDTGWYTYYDQQETIAKYKYHNININLVRYLYAITGHEELKVYQNWENYNNHFIVREFIKQPPNYFDVAIILICFFLCLVLSYFILMLYILIKAK